MQLFDECLLCNFRLERHEAVVLTLSSSPPWRNGDTTFHPLILRKGGVMPLCHRSMSRSIVVTAMSIEGTKGPWITLKHDNADTEHSVSLPRDLSHAHMPLRGDMPDGVPLRPWAGSAVFESGAGPQRAGCRNSFMPLAPQAPALLPLTSSVL